MGADLGEQALGAQIDQGQRWTVARDEHQVQALRPVAEQFAQKIVHSRAMNEMVVIQHQDTARRQLLKLIAERNDEWRRRWRLRRPEQREGLGARCREDRTDRCNAVVQENHQVAVVFIQRQPRRWCGLALTRSQPVEPHADQRSLAEAGCCTDQAQRSGQAVVEHFEQAWAIDPIPCHRWPVELGEQQG